MGLTRTALAVALLPIVAGQPGEVTLETVLNRTANYLDGYEQAIEGVTAVEAYTQRVGKTSVRTRVLESDVLFIRDDQSGWIEFRDVARVDGDRVRNRERRVEALFVKAVPDRLAQAQRIVREGARFNLNPSAEGARPGAAYRLNRTVNLPLTALRYLRRTAQPRSSFRLLAGAAVSPHVVLDFTEQAMPRLIATDDHTPARGRFEVDAVSGRVVESELFIQTRSVIGRFQVKYAEEPGIALWVPRSMNESYTGLSEPVTGRAEYSTYRRFQVQTDYDIGK